MSQLNAWILALVAVAILVAVADALTPEGMPRWVERLVGGLLILLVMLRPVIGGLENGLSQALAQMDGQEADWPQALEETDEALLERLITQSTQAYIENQAQELGITCTAQVECRWQDEVPVPSGVTITGTMTEEEQAALSALIQTELEIAVSEQNFREGTE
jgi:stage III sporulation protein AF